MKVTLIAATSLGLKNITPVEGTEFDRYHALNKGSSADRLAHFAGRACYQSWSMPNPDTATDEGYVANILRQAHHSVLEHASATFYIEGVSRSLTHELVRHRQFSFSQLSQRYADMSEAEFVIPPALKDVTEGIENEIFEDQKAIYQRITEYLQSTGLTRKQAREAARCILPNGMETKIVMTGNHRAWREMLQKHYNVHADAEIRELVAELLRQLRDLAPATYQDFPGEPFQ